MKIQKFEYFDKEESLSNEIKSIFRNTLSAVFWGKKKIRGNKL